jgi:6-phosphofructo-2-kinase
MNNNLAAAIAASTPPSPGPSPASSPEPDNGGSHKPLEVTLPPPVLHELAKVNGAFGSAHSRAETPDYALFSNGDGSGASTAESSPRIPPRRQNSGHQTPRVRPHATTLNIPGMTRSRASPDGRIPSRDVASKLVIIMVGLPARGKSYITKKLQRYLSWQQHNSRIFNVGNRRRVAAGVHPPPKKQYQSTQAAQVASILLNGAPAPVVDEPTELDLNASNGTETTTERQSETCRRWCTSTS